MASSFSLAPCLLFLLFIVNGAAQSQSSSLDFVYNGFNRTEKNFTLKGATIIKPSGALKLTNRSRDVIGHAFYPDPINLLNSFNNISSFSTSFVFSIIPSGSDGGGYGLAFLLSPSTDLQGAESGHFLGILNSINDGDESNHIFAVEFDTVNGHNEGKSSEGNHVGININKMDSIASEPASYYVNDTDKKEEVNLDSGHIQAWIDYADGVVNITIAPLSVPDKPMKPLMSKKIELSGVVTNSMYVGFSASTGEERSSHYILGWSFCINGTARPLNLSILPVPPIETDSSSLHTGIKVLITGLAVILLVFGAWLIRLLYRRKMKPEDLEDWELDYPHRFRYKDLYTSTKGFKVSEVIGVGGFATVYKGVLPTNGNEVAVKKIVQNLTHGMREFAAEIESLGRLRHKNLRFNILRGIAAGLLYLHEEWEKVVIHRDVKASNVLIDSDMNGRLGDFGLARLYDHGKNSHTTSVVGTIGYLAPELTRTGKASTSSDVFAYGVLLLEVACGKRPIRPADSQSSDHFILMDWVFECYQAGQILDAVDPRMNSVYVVEEVELVLRLGLFCSHPRPEARPTMRQVTRYLSRDDPLPIVDDWAAPDSSRFSDISPRFLQIVSTDTIASSCPSSSVGYISSGSIRAGR
ncbi:Lectin-domain containing receptor kinase VI.3 [Vitis vinifera]|uniref:non-specific serine/threonine protein kinase n=1 Tax=Vitis vinifera TaxID=29760 RepID=A0A438GC65_VITVI|nr:Lectin-domain containing receptor kinase VI.3 [Vitis vinifera]